MRQLSINVSNRIVHSRSLPLARLWASLETNDIHPIATFAHRNQESLITCPTPKIATELSQKLHKELGCSQAELSIAPYTLQGTPACILNTMPQYSTYLLNVIGLDQGELCGEMAKLFSWLMPKRGKYALEPIIQSLHIERTRSLEDSYHVRVEMRTDENHHIDFDELGQNLIKSEQRHLSLRLQGWSGALQLPKQKTILFYARSDITGTGLSNTLIEDAFGIQEVLEAGHAKLTSSTDLVKLSRAIRRLGYVQKLFLDGGDVEDDEKCVTPRRNEAHLPSSEEPLSLASVLDSIEQFTPMSNVIIIHLDQEGLFNFAALRSQLRVDASKANLTKSFDPDSNNFHRILCLQNLPYDLFHLIGHTPSDVDSIYNSIAAFEDTPQVPVQTIHFGPEPTNHLYSSAHTRSNPDPYQMHSHLHFQADSLDHHASLLFNVFLSLQSIGAIVTKMDAQKLIHTLDLSVIIEDDEDGLPSYQMLQAIPNGEIDQFLPLHLEAPTHSITVVSSRISAVCLRSLCEKTKDDLGEICRVRQLSIASSSKMESVGSDQWMNVTPNTRNATEDEVAAMNEVDCLELLVYPRRLDGSYASIDELAAVLKEVGLENGADVSFQVDTFERRNRRVATFDMDSTLIQMECIDEIAAYCGIGDQVKQITHRAMSGELDFEGALRERVSLLAGADARMVFEHVASLVPYTPHAKFLCYTLKALGFETAVLSGGFFPIIEGVKKHLKLNHAHANVLEIDHQTGKLTGRLMPDSKVIDATAKETHLVRLCTESSIDLDLSLAVGDGANDLKMLKASGIGIAFLAKSKVQEQCKFHINQLTLSPVLFLMGLSRDDCCALLQEDS